MAAAAAASSTSSSQPFLYLLLRSLLLLVAARLSSASLKLPLHHTLTLSPTYPQRPATVVSPVVSGASAGTGQYFVTLHLGSPPQPLHLVVDTGSDLIWARCSSSSNSSSSSPVDPLRPFHPLLSSSFCPLHCYDPLCRLVPRVPHFPCHRHTRIHSACRYNYTYGDGSFSSGIFASDITTVNTTRNGLAKLPLLHFGCAFHSSGPSVSGPAFHGAQGVLGLGRGPISFSTQLHRRFGNKFSYCLMDFTLSPPPTSFLIIGNHPSKNSTMAFTKLIANPALPTFYYVNVTSVSVDGVKLHIDPSVWALDETGSGGTVVDSGTTLTLIIEPAYSAILAAMRRRLELPEASPSGQVPFDLCVNVTGVRRPRLPRLRFGMEGEGWMRRKATFSPPARNYFIDTEEGVKCLGIQPVGDGGGAFSVIGNVMQQGYLWEFDNDRSRLGFTRRGCAVSP
ncbi:hypothetical protein MLD38_004383 [Melastoma candidum]|uniref:Uncharacterized protein n=1 Tax=Melastoma candidum TaxID=119954 RepID=A0ACB9SE33_9MYRT|nr:hypothetical protein MLD38_004383 [Melastoma candidum]